MFDNDVTKFDGIVGTGITALFKKTEFGLPVITPIFESVLFQEYVCGNKV
jgi:hypothetical protein